MRIQFPPGGLWSSPKSARGDRKRLAAAWNAVAGRDAGMPRRSYQVKDHSPDAAELAARFSTASPTPALERSRSFEIQFAFLCQSLPHHIVAADAKEARSPIISAS